MVIKHKMQLILNLIPLKRLTLTVFRNLLVRKIQRKKVLKTGNNIFMWVYCKQKLHTKVPGLVRVDEEKTNCDWIDLKYRGSLFYLSKDLLEEVEKYEKIFQKIHGESLDRGHDPIEKNFNFNCNKQKMASGGCKTFCKCKIFQ